MTSGDSFSRVSVTRPHGKVDTPKPRGFRSRAMRAPTRVHIRARSLVSWKSNATGPARKFHPDQPVQPRQARLPVDPTAPVRVCLFQPSLPTPFATSPTLTSCSEARKRLKSRWERPSWLWLNHGNARPSPKGGTRGFPLAHLRPPWPLPPRNKMETIRDPSRVNKALGFPPWRVAESFMTFLGSKAVSSSVF
ncbi:hypothetical protein CRG98_025351 [Punica granatum]|uniref:Uncharacterized protein n=1 Tax=Punica granatum TaxID=22663 RepID=A0A2I0JDF5_PUNGR|nr:hypothetical protein CRG98_025351 [Punica granatum]